MQAIILAGGKGTRLRPYTTILPKPMMPIGEKPILEILINKLVDSGIKKIIISVGYLAGIIQSYFGNGEKFGADIDYFIEAEPLGTVGCLALINNLEDEFIVLNGDILSDLSFSDLTAHHRRSGKKVTICSYKKEVPISLGVLKIDGDMVQDYIEKPTYNFYVSMGVYVMDKSIVRNIPPNKYFDFPTLIKKLISLDEPINVYKFEGDWFDIGREEDYKLVLDKFDNG